jgi:hypothetical protein
MIRNQNNFSNYKLVTLQLTLKLGINEMFCVLESSRTLAVTYNNRQVIIYVGEGKGNVFRAKILLTQHFKNQKFDCLTSNINEKINTHSGQKLYKRIPFS